MRDRYRNKRGAEIEIIARRGKWLWIETERPNGETDRGRIKATDKFELVRGGVWERIDSA